MKTYFVSTLHKTIVYLLMSDYSSKSIFARTSTPLFFCIFIAALENNTHTQTYTCTCAHTMTQTTRQVKLNNSAYHGKYKFQPGSYDGLGIIFQVLNFKGKYR